MIKETKIGKVEISPNGINFSVKGSANFDGAILTPANLPAGIKGVIRDGKGLAIGLTPEDIRILKAEEKAFSLAAHRDIDTNEPCPYCGTYCNGDCRAHR